MQGEKKKDFDFDCFLKCNAKFVASLVYKLQILTITCYKKKIVDFVSQSRNKENQIPSVRYNKKQLNLSVVGNWNVLQNFMIILL